MAAHLTTPHPNQRFSVRGVVRQTGGNPGLDTVYAAIRCGELKAARPGIRSYSVRWRDYETWLESRAAAPDPYAIAEAAARLAAKG
jgi:hypothetical protein